MIVGQAWDFEFEMEGERPDRASQFTARRQREVRDWLKPTWFRALPEQARVLVPDFGVAQARPLARGSRRRSEQLEAKVSVQPLLRIGGGHTVRDVFFTDGGEYVGKVCVTCGAFGASRSCHLARVCPGYTVQSKAAQISRIRRGRHPNAREKRQVRVSELEVEANVNCSASENEMNESGEKRLRPPWEL
eukprot:2153908-Amphidinium_carterae.2